ncbi:TRAP-type C4-dicarboxylate transport system permease small subunit [Cricetibacter osteomyelitidis]|uniref:TRAP transporter small permease protein n=1 Tax=Cricetibacter osteomyelitidis TaxID=1521931 RepID=A0A4R2T6S0_9PAST|nr:TRAP transporter small permease [Cricetibacter osteomyelitidis]TCP96564.1 TRAP-type C4-dicarboxylate transport system permease small subunit [Cricetibacter osteomyelitidis]
MKVVSILDKTLKTISILALVCMISLVFFNAILRYFFHSGIAWSEEFARICFVYMIFFGIILVARDKGHLTVDIVTSNISIKFKKLFTIISDLLILFAMLLVSYGAAQLMELTYTQRMPATELSSALLYLASFVSSVTYFCMTLYDLYKNVSVKEN